jgi:hypothetical protein
MSIFKPTTASGYYINSVAAIASPSTALQPAPAVESVVMGSELKPGIRVERPGVFTEGTPREGSQLNYSASN